MTTPISISDGSLVNPWLAAGCQQFQALLAEREELLNVVLSVQDLQPDDAAVLQMAECEARTLKAAHDFLDASVHGPGDLYAKYSTILLHEEFYLERAALLQPLLQQICADVRSILDNTIHNEASQAVGGGLAAIEGASLAAATDLAQVSD